MSDRTWNAVDARLYEEDWSQGAIIVAACLLAKCPNQYGVFEMPWGFFNLFFKGLYTRSEIEGFVIEWETSGFIKLYNDRKTVWIVKKWGRSKYSTVENNQVGAFNYLDEYYPYIVADFRTRYPLSAILVPPKPPKTGTPDTDAEPEADAEPEKRFKKEKGKETKGNGENFRNLPKVSETDRNPEYIDLTRELFPNMTDTRDLYEQVDALDKLIRLDRVKIGEGMSEDAWKLEVFAVLRWMRADTEPHGKFPGWSGVFQSIPRLRLRQEGRACHKFLNARAGYVKFKQNSKPRSIDDDSKFEGMQPGRTGL